MIALILLAQVSLSNSSHDTAYYNSLIDVVCSELEVVLDERPALKVVVISQETMQKLVSHNPCRWDSEWQGSFNPPGLIFLTPESDDTFIHEFLHWLRFHGLFFVGWEDQLLIEKAIREMEGSLLGSESYLKFLSQSP